MNVGVETLDGCKRALRVEVSPETMAAKVEETVRRLAQTRRIPGFRPGRIPREIVARRFRGEIREEVLRNVIPDAFASAVRERALEPVGPPQVDEIAWDEGQALRFRAVVEVKPNLEVRDYKGIEAFRDPIEVTDEQVDRALQVMQEEAAEYVPMDGWPALRDDLVILDHEGTINGKAFRGSRGTNLSIVLAAGGYLPGFEEQIVGMEKGETKEFSLHFPADYPRRDLAGKEARFRVAVKEVKKRRVPRLDADFAKSVGECEDLDALREKVRQALRHRKAQAQEADLKAALVEKVAAGVSEQVPEGLVEAEAEALLADLFPSVRGGAGSSRWVEGDLETLRGKARDAARRRVKGALVLEAVARQEGIEVSEEELAHEIRALATATRQEAGALRQSLEAEGRLDALRERVRRRKAQDFLYEHARITEGVNLVKLA